MKIVLWIGNESNQKALAHKIHAQFEIAGIVTESRKGKRKWTIQIFIEKVVEKLFLSMIGHAWFGMKSNYERQYPDYPQVPHLDVENINSNEVFEFTKNLNPDLILVSGTRLVKEKLLSLPVGIGILNLHTGLSPYVKGGPNCTNWCIATNQFHLIGNTIMWIDKGIDTGNIITTESIVFKGDESLLDVHVRVMEHAHGLYLSAIDSLKNGAKPQVKQDTITAGKTYYTKEWTIGRKFDLKKNFKSFQRVCQSEAYQKALKDLITIPISYSK